MTTTVETGRHGEDLATQYVTNSGYRIEARNWHFPGGELDLLCWQDDTLIVIEVKARTGDSFGTPEEAVTEAKKERLLMGGLAYLNAHDLDVDWRIDVITIQFAASGRVWRLDHYEGAVWYDG